MQHSLTPLSYSLDALEPYISRETLEYHHGKHHQSYVDNLNKLIVWTEFENMPLEEIIQKSTSGPIFNNAAQIWNHTFYFEGMWPQNEWSGRTQDEWSGRTHGETGRTHDEWSGRTHGETGRTHRFAPTGKIWDQINETWGSFESFQAEFNKMALSNFWSGWTWLVAINKQGEHMEKQGEHMEKQGEHIGSPLQIISTSNATTPLTNPDYIPLLTCDIWEHAYYIDYRNARAKYLENFWNVINWERINDRLIEK